MLLSAARELVQAGELAGQRPLLLRRRGGDACGHSIVDFLESDERGADAAVIFDSVMIRRDVPAFNIATRGVVYFHLTLRTGERDLHSGVYGGAALNAAHAMGANSRRAHLARRHARRLAAKGDRGADRRELRAGPSCPQALPSSPTRGRARKTNARKRTSTSARSQSPHST